MVVAARLDADRAVRGDSMAYSGLRAGGRDHDGFSDGPRRSQKRVEARSVDSIVIAKQELHRGVT
jgi:hypothetical protein